MSVYFLIKYLSSLFLFSVRFFHQEVKSQLSAWKLALSVSAAFALSQRQPFKSRSITWCQQDAWGMSAGTWLTGGSAVQFVVGRSKVWSFSRQQLTCLRAGAPSTNMLPNTVPWSSKGNFCNWPCKDKGHFHTNSLFTLVWINRWIVKSLFFDPGLISFQRTKNTKAGKMHNSKVHGGGDSFV